MKQFFTKIINAKNFGLRAFLFMLLVSGAVFCVCEAVTGYSIIRGFLNPVAFTAAGDRFYVLEKNRNTLLDLEYESGSTHLKLRRAIRIEKDDKNYYYMVRQLYSAGDTFIVQSYIYDKTSDDFLGYRFREYNACLEASRDIFTIHLKNPGDYPEIYYARSGDGFHVFVNNCAGHANIWKIPVSETGVRMADGIVPDIVVETGESNTEFSCWGPASAGPDNHIYVSCHVSGKIVKYSPAGERVAVIGETGFGGGKLLAPGKISVIHQENGVGASLVVASTGNRSWVVFDCEGRIEQAFYPLNAGYPYKDILVGEIFRDRRSGGLFSFDLANKALVKIGDDFAALPSYSAVRLKRSLFAGGLGLLLFAGAVFVLRRPLIPDSFRFPFFLKLLFLFIPLILLGAYISGDWVRDVMKLDITTESIRRSANLAWAIRNSVAVADLEKLQMPEDRNSETYEKIFAIVNNIMDQSAVEDTPKWVIHKIRDNRFYFGVNIWRGPLFEPFIVPRDREMFFRVLRDKTPQYGEFVDSQGDWFSYLCPVTNKAGQVVNVIELYRSSERLRRADERAMIMVAKISGITALLLIVAVLIFSYVTTRPLAALQAATRIISNGDFNHRVHVRSHDELADLASSFNRMAVDLGAYTVDLAKNVAEREKMRNELNFASKVQRGILPSIFPPFEGAESVEIVARMETAREIGGDYFDFFMVDENHMGVVIADVSDKGVAAGLFMMDVRTIMRTNAIGRLSPAEALEKTNRMIVLDNPAMMFVSMFYMICDIRTGKVSFCNAGHNPPVLVKRHQPFFLKNEQGMGAGPVAGVLEDAQYTDAGFVLEEGEYILLYTDGVTECTDANLQMYGEERLLDCLSKNSRLSNNLICDNLFKELSMFYKGVDQFDDITVLFFRFLGAPPVGGANQSARCDKTEFVIPV